MGKGAKTVIPSFAGAKVSFRLAPVQSASRIAGAFERWLTDRTPPGCRWQIEPWGSAEPVIVSTDSPWLAAARRAMAAGCGTEPVLVSEGATNPVVGSFKQTLGIDTLLMGFGRHDDAIHSPNEKFELACFDMGCRSHAALVGALGSAAGSSAGPAGP
jgi:acetylornithine deacetylase/succinyl-diaminopimelate desuccinylase-like protein